MKIKEIKELLKKEVPQEILNELSKDKRKGVEKELEKYYKKQKQKEFFKKEYQKRTIYEKKLYDKGYKYICGIDEVGRGPLAGPLVVACVILKKDSFFEGLCDSKKIPRKKREELAEKIKKEALDYAIFELDNFEIEKYNIYGATKVAMKECIKKLKIKPDFLLIDAMKIENEIKSLSIIKGDDKSVSIAAASVIAKVYRDKKMTDLAKIYPYYDFENNMGYGTKKHLDGLKKYGFCKIHRRDFEPIKTMIKEV